jgi:hypothetical protein
LRRGVAEHALELLVHALRTERSVEDDESVRGTLEELFEILAANVEKFFGTGDFGIRVSRSSRLRVP